MTSIEFYKFQATGNDFIMVDDRQTRLELTNDQIERLCDRKFGIGSDGLILIRNHTDYDFEMVFYNPDGSQSLCGNGSRCAVNFAKHLNIIEKQTYFLAYDGGHKAFLLENGDVRLKMTDIQNVTLMEDGIFIDTGSPHLLKYVEDVRNYAVYENGKAIRNNSTFAEKGVNVNFVEVTGTSDIFVRTYERGVENETLSCGTGVTAAALSAGYKGMTSPIKVTTRGGVLSVEFEKMSENVYKEVYLAGPAKQVFRGTFELDK